MIASLSSTNFALLLVRFAVGSVFVAHGVNHIFGGGKITGTARWFESLGMRPGIMHAWTASLTEIASGISLIVGFLTPVGGSGIVGCDGGCMGDQPPPERIFHIPSGGRLGICHGAYRRRCCRRDDRSRRVEH